jgi:tetratricopeptide (TPR) repeat protein
MKRRLIELLVAFAALAVLYQVSRSVEHISTRNLQLETLYLPSGSFLKCASLGYRNLAADVLWTRTVQYYGGYWMGENDLALFKHLITVITDLDPQFVFAYLFGALIIAEDLGHFDEGVAFLEKGMWANPTDWWLPFEIGFLHYVHARDFEEAMRYFRLASRLPGADDITRRFAAFVASRAGHAETSIVMWRELAETTDNANMRDLAERNIEKLEAELATGREEGE